MDVQLRKEGTTNTLQYWLSLKPLDISKTAGLCGLPYWKMRRIVRGESPAPISAVYVLAGLLGRPFEELFEEREYANGTKRQRGWFPRPYAQAEQVAS